MRTQLQNRDDLINSLLTQKTVNDTSNSKQEHFQGNIFIKPKKTVKSVNKIPNEYNISFNNRYEALFDENNDINGNDNDNAITPQQTDNVTKRKKKSKKPITNDKNKKRVVAIVGDSMLKHIKGYKLSNKDNKCVVKTFPGARTSCMEHYVIPTLNQQPDVVIIHCGTNDLKVKQPDEVCQNVINLAKSISSSNENTSVVISGIVPRGDDLNQKATEVNGLLEKKCNDCNIGFINNGNIDPRRHLNNSRLHLNVNGTLELEKNLRNMIDC